jgi:hypothetical protein
MNQYKLNVKIGNTGYTEYIQKVSISFTSDSGNNKPDRPSRLGGKYATKRGPYDRIDDSMLAAREGYRVAFDPAGNFT